MGKLNNGTLERNDPRHVALSTGRSRGIDRACADGLSADGRENTHIAAGSAAEASET